jgi:hypothetical protein
MHDLPTPKRALATLFGRAVGGLGFLLSFVLSMTVFVLQGNPGFLFIWLAAAIATGACMRAHVRWRKSCERMYASDAVRACYPARKGWRHEVEDIAFRDLPDTSMSFSQ